jgi:late competence protein required for DNA uptake (superfamily II DNA/RNA helicase)
VLFAVPRSDVVAEVAPRISAAMQGSSVVALRGASRERFRDADIVVATTHQALRFYRAFDLVVLDEADAFPFRGSRMLRHALRRATAPDGKTIYMTATPDDSLLVAANRGEIAVTRISARHHGYPLPVPEIVITPLLPACESDVLSRPSMPGRRPNYPRAPQAPPTVASIVEDSLRAGHRVFVFVPTVDLAGRVCALLRASLISPGWPAPRDPAVLPVHFDSPAAAATSTEASVLPARLALGGSEVHHGPDFQSTALRGVGDSHDVRRASTAQLTCPADSGPGVGRAVGGRDPSPAHAARARVAFVHSRHPDRDRIREAFKDGGIDVLVTTTILERGINVHMADVVVLYADFERVFDVGTLVQMAGRAGRSQEYPCARVYYVAERTSPAMRAAVASIRDMNEHAAKSGYLVTRDCLRPT